MAFAPLVFEQVQLRPTAADASCPMSSTCLTLGIAGV